MAVLKQTSPRVSPNAPRPLPRQTVPSSRTRTASGAGSARDTAEHACAMGAVRGSVMMGFLPAPGCPGVSFGVAAPAIGTPFRDADAVAATMFLLGCGLVGEGTCPPCRSDQAVDPWPEQGAHPGQAMAKEERRLAPGGEPHRLSQAAPAPGDDRRVKPAAATEHQGRDPHLPRMVIGDGLT